MNLPRLLSLAGGLVILATTGATALCGAEEPPSPTISMKVTKKIVTNENAGSRQTSTFVERKSSGNDFFYIIDVRNSSAAPAPEVQISYIVYNRVTRGNSRGRTSEVARLAGSETVAVDRNSTTTVQTRTIPGTNTSTKDQYQNYLNDTVGSGTVVSSTSNQLVGVYIEAKLDGVVVARYENPSGVKAKMELNK